MNSKPVWKIEKIVLPQHADHAGVMWHGTYFNWLEESRINALLEVGISYFELTKKGFDLPLIDTSIKYKSPLFLGEKITIESEFNIYKVMFNRKNRSRKMKKIFQWEEYLNWKNMSKEQKLNFKRACLFPFLVYIVYVFLNQYSLAILLLIGLYFLIRFKNRNKLGR